MLFHSTGTFCKGLNLFLFGSSERMNATSPDYVDVVRATSLVNHTWKQEYANPLKLSARESRAGFVSAGRFGLGLGWEKTGVYRKRGEGNCREAKTVSNERMCRKLSWRNDELAQVASVGRGSFSSHQPELLVEMGQVVETTLVGN